MMYGTSNVPSIQPGQLMRHLLVMRAPNDYFSHHTIKTIAKPHRIKNNGKHALFLLRGRICCK